MMYRHGLRVSEAIALRREHVNMNEAKLWVQRHKFLDPSNRSTATNCARSSGTLRTRRPLPWLFISERGQPLTRQAVNYLIPQAGERAGLPDLHPHMLRHSCGFYLANSGQDLRLIQDYLGHRDVRHSVRYTRVAGRRFEGLWKA